MGVGPLNALRNNAAIAHCVVQVSWSLVHLVGGAEVQLIEGAAVANYDLARVLVGHHNSGHGEQRALRVRVVGGERLFSHANMVVITLLECGPTQTLINTVWKLTGSKTRFRKKALRFGS
jgi:hypothetical protein